jgi:hypothetical protein
MTAIHTNLDSLIFDIFYLIASRLDCDDYVHLSQVNRRLKTLLQDDVLSKRIIEVSVLSQTAGT